MLRNMGRSALVCVPAGQIPRCRTRKGASVVVSGSGSFPGPVGRLPGWHVPGGVTVGAPIQYTLPSVGIHSHPSKLPKFPRGPFSGWLSRFRRCSIQLPSLPFGDPTVGPAAVP